MHSQTRLDRAAFYLSFIQFLFATTWIVYVIYLGDLLDRIGIGREYLIWFVLLDQVVFAISDTIMGYAADKIERSIGKLGPSIIAINLVSCLAFILLPIAPGMADQVVSAPLFTVLLVVWIATSSVLRAPPLVLLTKRAARPNATRLAALSLLGLALGGAAAPYIGLLLKGADPLLPFLVTAVSLMLATFGLIRVERISRNLPEQDKQPPAAQSATDRPAVALLLISILLIASGLQINTFVNSKPLYLNFVTTEQLILVLPLFWVGFKLFALPGAAAARHYGPIPILATCALMGALALLLVEKADSLAMLITGQMLAGGAWGVVFTTGIGAAVNFGTSGREGLILGLLFTMISLATFGRAGLVAGGITKSSEHTDLLLLLPVPLWLSGGLILLVLAYITRRKKPWH